MLIWIKHAWDSISPERIRKSFKKSGISNSLDGSEDYLFQVCSDDEDPFEGFEQDDVVETEEVLQNICASPQNIEISESECELDSDLNESESDYNSPGHGLVQQCLVPSVHKTVGSRFVVY